jgi:hypothetical protein
MAKNGAKGGGRIGAVRQRPQTWNPRTKAGPSEVPTVGSWTERKTARRSKAFAGSASRCCSSPLCA